MQIEINGGLSPRSAHSCQSRTIFRIRISQPFLPYPNDLQKGQFPVIKKKSYNAISLFVLQKTLSQKPNSMNIPESYSTAHVVWGASCSDYHAAITTNTRSPIFQHCLTLKRTHTPQKHPPPFQKAKTQILPPNTLFPKIYAFSKNPPSGLALSCTWGTAISCRSDHGSPGAPGTATHAAQYTYRQDRAMESSIKARRIPRFFSSRKP